MLMLQILFNCKYIIRIDVCGGLVNEQDSISIGDIIIPKLAFCDEGTTPHYIREHPSLVNELESIPNPIGKFQNLFTGNQTVFISKPNESLRELFIKKGIALFPKKVKESNLWTTDALFCESLDFIRALLSVNVHIVDMESSILFLLGKIYNLKTISLLSVSDLPGHPKYDLLNSNEIHPDMENGIDNAIKLLIQLLPNVKKEI